jgi:CRP-like cAMP-binding protein
LIVHRRIVNGTKLPVAAEPAAGGVLPSPVMRHQEGQRADVRQWQVFNRILLVLPREIRKQIITASDNVEFRSRQLIYRARAAVESAYFINRGLVSLIKNMEDGRTVEIGAVGVEGIVGLGAAFESGRALTDCIAQLPVAALRINCTVLQREIARHDVLRDAISRHHLLLSEQLAQVSACNRLHSLEQRCCHWLLVARDSASSDELQLSHEFLALMLGTQRPSVSMILKGLKQRSSIHYTHGRVTIVDRAALEEHACECYRTRRRQLEEMFPSPSQ